MIIKMNEELGKKNCLWCTTKQCGQFMIFHTTYKQYTYTILLCNLSSMMIIWIIDDHSVAYTNDTCLLISDNKFLEFSLSINKLRI